MPWQDNGFIGKREDFFPDPADQEFMITMGEIGSADPAAKEHITSEQHRCSFEILVIEGAETEAVGRMTGHVQQSQALAVVSDFDGGFSGKQVVDLEGLEFHGPASGFLEDGFQGQVRIGI